MILVFPQNFILSKWYFADLPTQLKEKVNTIENLDLTEEKSL